MNYQYFSDQVNLREGIIINSHILKFNGIIRHIPSR